LIINKFRDEAGFWWFINLKAMKVKNATAVMENNISLEYFTNRVRNDTLVRSVFYFLI